MKINFFEKFIKQINLKYWGYHRIFTTATNDLPAIITNPAQ